MSELIHIRTIRAWTPSAPSPVAFAKTARQHRGLHSSEVMTEREPESLRTRTCQQVVHRSRVPRQSKWSFVAVACTLVPVLFGAPTPQKERSLEGAYPRGKGVPVPTEEAYERVWDTAFASAKEDWRTTQFSLVLRFLPSFHPELQIIIRCGRDTEPLIRYSKARAPAHEVLMSAFAGQRDPDPTAVAKQMEVRHSILKVSQASAERWVEGFWRSLAESTTSLENSAFEGGIMLDPTIYRLEYSQRFNTLSFSFQDVEIGRESQGNLPVIRWMNGVRREIEGMLAERSQP